MNNASKVFLGISVFTATAVFGGPAVVSAAADKTPPTLTTFTPSGNSTQTPVDVVATATFNEDLRKNTTPSIVMTGKSGIVPTTTTYDAATRTATVKPNAVLPLNTTFKVTVLIARDTANNFMIPKSWDFTTVALPASSKGLTGITFDDGPDKVRTPAILDTLKSRGVKATFFLNGSKIKGNEHIVKRMQDEGHVIGSHGWDHTNFKDIDEDPDNGLTPLTYEQAKASIVDTANAIKAVTGINYCSSTNNVAGCEPMLFRYPYGDESEAGNRVIREEGAWGHIAWYWRKNPAPLGTLKRPIVFEGDWVCSTPQSMLREYLTLNTVDQGLSLLHDSGDAAACSVSHWNYLGPTIDSLKAVGWDFGVAAVAYAPNPQNDQSWVRVASVVPTS